jgi:hypothetical protein
LLAAQGSHRLNGAARQSLRNAKAESFMKTMKVEEVYPMAYETFADVPNHVPRFIDEFTMPAVSTPLWASSARNSSRAATPGLRSNRQLIPVQS